MVEVRAQNEKLEVENLSLRAHIDSLDEMSTRKMRDITTESEQKVSNREKVIIPALVLNIIYAFLVAL